MDDETEETARERDGVWFMLLGIGLPLILIAVAVWGGPAAHWLIRHL